MQKRLFLCADDYGQNTDISDGIMQLADGLRINAISCLVNSTVWHETHRALQRVKNTHFIGLHFNVTFGRPLSAEWQREEGDAFEGLHHVLQKTYCRRYNIKVVMAEMEAQLDAFIDAMQVAPDFIDGHQHVHQLPVIRDALQAVYAKHSLSSFIRSTSNGWRDFSCLDSFPKRQIIALLGGRALSARLQQQSIPRNTGFSGVYSFKKSSNYRHYFNIFFSNSRDGGLIMCHPGNVSIDFNDPLYQYRHNELEYLLGDAFLSDLEDNSFQ